MSNDRMRIGSPGAQLPVNSSGARKTAPVTRETEQQPQTVAAANGTQAAPTQAPAAQKIEAVAERLETYLRSVSRSLEFRVDSASGRTVVSVRDSETGDLIRQIPGDEVLRLAEMADDQTIVLVNETV